eukprot:357204-Chlamydomonas_euryale.AAC.7
MQHAKQVLPLPQHGAGSSGRAGTALPLRGAACVPGARLCRMWHIAKIKDALCTCLVWCAYTWTHAARLLAVRSKRKPPCCAQQTQASCQLKCPHAHTHACMHAYVCRPKPGLPCLSPSPPQQTQASCQLKCPHAHTHACMHACMYVSDQTWPALPLALPPPAHALPGERHERTGTSHLCGSTRSRNGYASLWSNTFCSNVVATPTQLLMRRPPSLRADMAPASVSRRAAPRRPWREGPRGAQGGLVGRGAAGGGARCSPAWGRRVLTAHDVVRVHSDSPSDGPGSVRLVGSRGKETAAGVDGRGSKVYGCTVMLSSAPREGEVQPAAAAMYQHGLRGRAEVVRGLTDGIDWPGVGKVQEWGG